MKALIGLIVIVGAVVAVVYYAGGSAEFDPNKQGTEARAKVTPGMSWKEVADQVGAPREYQPMIEKRVGQDVFIKPGAANRYNAETLAALVRDGGVPHGFRFRYHFSNSVAFYVNFDKVGNVLDVEDAATMATLLDQQPR